MKPVLPSDAQKEIIKSIGKAYVFGHISTTGPKALKLLANAISKRPGFGKVSDQVLCLLAEQSAINRFPAFCAVVIGGTLGFQQACSQVLLQWLGEKRPSTATAYKVANRFSTFLAALIGISLLNMSIRQDTSIESIPLEQVSRKPEASPKRASRRRSSVHLSSEGNVIAKHAVAQQLPLPVLISTKGKSLAFTAFALTRALDIVVRSCWASRTKQSKVSTSHLPRYAEKLADPALFAASSFVVMWAWFFTPERLPRSYNGWISSIAQIDARLIQALREVRYGNFVYGKNTGMAPLLGSLCRELGMPIEWGDPAKTIPIPCELYHAGSGPSCEWHALVRFARAWSFAIRMYLPLNLVLLWRKKPVGMATARVFVEAGRSSAFLGAFVAFFYYAVCLARTRLGPKLFSRDRITPQMWDGGLCVAAGCMACGWSIFLEKPSRRQEIAFFVAPRALATILPQRYNRKYFWREQLVFATSAAIVLTTAQENPKYVRGVLGRLLQQILN